MMISSLQVADKVKSKLPAKNKHVDEMAPMHALIVGQNKT